MLVGGAAASIYTGGMITSGDFDVIAAADTVFDRVMVEHGFKREDRAGHLLIGYYHPDIPTIGVQLVSGSLFDGRTDPHRIALLPIKNGGTIALPPIEDLIADRLGQYAASGDRDDEMLEQARLLFKLAGDIDKRISGQACVGGNGRSGSSRTEMTVRRLPALSTFLEIVAERRRLLEIGDDAYARARNSGRRRTPEKREFLRRIHRRARQAGAEPFEANF